MLPDHDLAGHHANHPTVGRVGDRGMVKLIPHGLTQHYGLCIIQLVFSFTTSKHQITSALQNLLITCCRSGSKRFN